LLNNTSGGSNVGLGWNTLRANTTGGSNTAIGAGALQSNVTGSNNIGIGNGAGLNLTAGNNTVVGTEAGGTLTTGSNNTIVGYDAEPSSATVSNQVTVGNASVTNFRIPGVGFDIDTNRASVTGYAKVSEYYASTAPVLKTADFTLADTENYIINNAGGNITVTLPSGPEYIGRSVTFINHVNHKIVSASSNVIPHNGGAAQTDITAANNGRFSTIVYDGTNWYIMATNA
jgi:hypothetical protein